MNEGGTETETETGIAIEIGIATEAGRGFGTTAIETETEVETEIAVTELGQGPAHENIRATARGTATDGAEAQERRAVAVQKEPRKNYRRKSSLASKKRLWPTSSGTANESRLSNLNLRSTRS